jgi:hypothetical protein
MEALYTDAGGFLVFYGLEIGAVVLLIASLIVPRVLVVVIIVGVVAAGLMVVEWVLWWILANMDHAEPGWQTNLKVVSAISIVSLLIYSRSRSGVATRTGNVWRLRHRYPRRPDLLDRINGIWKARPLLHIRYGRMGLRDDWIKAPLV